LLLAHGEKHGIRVQPNPQIVVVADKLLGRRRALVTALLERCERARTWWKYWERHGWAEVPQPAAEFPPPREGLQQVADALLAAVGLPYSDVTYSAVRRLWQERGSQIEAVRRTGEERWTHPAFEGTVRANARRHDVPAIILC